VIGAGLAGLLAIFMVGGGCHPQSEALYSELKYETPLTPAKGVLFVAGTPIVVSGIVLNKALQELGLQDAEPSKQRGKHPTLSQIIDRIGMSMTFASALLLVAYTGVLIWLVRRGIDPWSFGAPWRSALRTPIVGVASIGVVPFCLSVVGVCAVHGIAPAFQTEAWLVAARASPRALAEANPSIA